jgi:hypothetical protein
MPTTVARCPIRVKLGRLLLLPRRVARQRTMLAVMRIGC